jgi:hypothetical protein
MRRTLTALLASGLVFGFASTASAHIGDTVYLIFEIPTVDVADLDFDDLSIADWEDVVGDPSVTAADMFADPTVGEGAQYDPADMDYRIWIGWNGDRNVVYAAMERTDNVFVNEYAGGALGDLWRHDGSFEFMLDGDHTGGDYTGSADPDWTEEEQTLNNNRSAQQYVGIADAPDGRHIGYQGAGVDWVTVLPYSDGGGGTVGDGPATSVIEFFVTPFDDCIWNSPDDSQASPLSSGKIVGFQLSIPDFDTEPGAYRAFHTLTGQASTWRYAERFADGRLVGADGGGPSAVEAGSWGRIKASFNE